MNLIEIFKEKKIDEIHNYMEKISGKYQSYNPLTFPVEADENNLVLSKLKNLNYKKEDFKDKTITDLGCCLGFFSFYSSFLGAKKVIGYDYNEDYLNFNKSVLEYDLLNGDNNYKDKVFFVQETLTELPKIEKTDIILAHAIIHWLIILNDKINHIDIIKWLFDSCDEAVFIEGCLDYNDPTMKRYNVPKERLDLNSFLEESKKIFSKVELVGNMDYCDTRVVLRMYK